MEKTAIVPGSYDPVTAGHMEVIRSAAGIFDHVYAVILDNSEKSRYMFTAEQKLEILECAINALKDEGIENVGARLYSGLTVDAARELGAGFVVKGVRSPTDFDYEYGMAEITRRFDSSLQTVFIPSTPQMSCVSSTYVREIIKYAGKESGDFAKGTYDTIMRIYKSNNEKI